MSTRCYIGIENEDKTVDYIYCHHDGYISGVGKVLLENYQDKHKIRKLLELGGLSSLGTEPVALTEEEDSKNTVLMRKALLSGELENYFKWRKDNYDKYCDAYGPDDPDPVRHSLNRKLYESEAPSDIEYIYLYTKTGWKVFKAGRFSSYKVEK